MDADLWEGRYSQGVRGGWKAPKSVSPAVCSRMPNGVDVLPLSFCHWLHLILSPAPHLRSALLHLPVLQKRGPEKKCPSPIQLLKARSQHHSPRGLLHYQIRHSWWRPHLLWYYQLRVQNKNLVLRNFRHKVQMFLSKWYKERIMNLQHHWSLRAPRQLRESWVHIRASEERSWDSVCLFKCTHSKTQATEVNNKYFIDFEPTKIPNHQASHSQKHLKGCYSVTLCHSTENWRCTQKAKVCVPKWGPKPKVCLPLMADRSFHCLWLHSQTSTACTSWFHISVTKALFLSPSFLLLTLKAHCPSKNPKCE